MAKFSRNSLVNYIVDNMDSPDLPEKIAGFLIDNGKVSELDSILRDVMEARASKTGIVELSVTSAFELTADNRQAIKQTALARYPSANDVIIHETVDKSVIGGVDIKFANANLDLTIKTKLNKLREAVA